MSNQQFPGWRDRMRLRIAERQFERIVDASINDLRPRFEMSMVVAILISVAVLLTPLAVAGLGLFLILWSGFTVFATIIGTLLLGMAWVLLPAIDRLNGDARQRDDVPSLFDLIDRLADHMGAPRIDGIVVTPDLNAFVGKFGRRRMIILGVGIPLWQAMDERERLSVLAHELAHEINGDPARSFLIGSAEYTLEAWVDMLTPVRNPAFEDAGFGSGPADQIMAALADIVSLALRGLVRLRMRTSQRAEYYADLLSAKAVGYEAAVAAEYRLVLRPAIEGLLRSKYGRAEGAGQKLTEEIRPHLDGLSSDVVEKLHARMKTERSSVDLTHPPTVYRLRFLENHTGLAGDFDASDINWTEIDRELEAFLEPIGQLLLEDPDLL